MPSIHTLLKSVAALLALAATTAVDARSALVVADTELVSLAVNTTARIATQNLIAATRGSFMTVHFAQFNLAQGDKVIVRDAAGTTKYEYTGLGRGDTGLTGGFYSSRLPGNQAVVEYLPAAASSASGAYGYTVDKITRSTTDAVPSKICGTGDQTRPAKCYIGSAEVPQAYEKSRAVTRLLIDGGEACTGWLIGSEGHMVTNHHCIYNDQRALHTDVEIAAEGSSCSDECKSWGACRGTIIATTSELIAVDEALDYALVKLNTNVDLTQYGYFQLRTQGPVAAEQIYIPQHPQHWAKRIAVFDDNGSVARVTAIGNTVCGDYTVGYTADTDGGASGSPVVGASDNQVIALHNCGLKSKCENGGSDSRTLLWHWKQKGISVKNAVADPTVEIPVGPWIPGYTAAPTPVPTTAAPTSGPTSAPTPAPSTAAPAPTPTTAAPSTGPTPAPTNPADKACAIFKQQSSCEKTFPGKCVWADGKCIGNPANVTPAPTTAAPTPVPTTVAPTPVPTTVAPTPVPTTVIPTPAPSTIAPTPAPSSDAPTAAPTPAPTNPADKACAIFKTEERCKSGFPGKCAWIDGKCVGNPANVTPAPTTVSPTPAPTTETPTPVPTTVAPTPVPTTVAPTPVPTTVAPTPVPTTVAPTPVPTTVVPTPVPTTVAPTPVPTTVAPTPVPTTVAPTPVPTTVAPTPVPTTVAPTPVPTTVAPTPVPTTVAPTPVPTTVAPTPVPTTVVPTPPPTPVPTTQAPTPTSTPTTQAPTPAPTPACVPSGGYCGSDATGPNCCASEGDYCQPWNPTYYQCRPIAAKCGKQEVGVDYYGDDLTTVHDLLPEQCCDKCHATAGCTAYTFVNFNGKGRTVCYLKKGTGERRALVGAVSATIVGATPPPPVCAPSGGYCGNDREGPSCCSSGEYCQPWNPSYYQCRPAPQQCGAQQVGVDFYGDDLATLRDVLPADCCAKCADTAGCKAYTHVNFNSDGRSACYLKKGTGEARKVIGAVSAVVTNPKPDCSTPVGGNCGSSQGTTCCPSGSYCQPWNQWYYQCVPQPAQCSQQITDVDFYGSDIRTVSNVSPGECCDQCRQTAGCKAYTFVNSNPNGRTACYLKSGQGQRRALSGAVSGILN